MNKLPSLSKDTRYLLLIGMLYLTGTSIAMTFIQIYLVRLTSDIGGIILQNVLNYAALLASYMLGS